MASAGERISGTLRLIRPIAEGGMGSVWIAEHLVLGREVAIKRMAPQWAAMPNARPRFLREARMTARVDSPHVVRVLDCRIDEGDEPYLVLELLHGMNLEQRVGKSGPLSVFEVLAIVTQTCNALHACHLAGIVHRDVKPENVFLCGGPGAFVKLLDFGVAKPTSPDECLDVDRLPAGTPQYMSPEHIFEPEATDARSDLFSLGAVAYFALTGRAPFTAESLEGRYLAIERSDFDRPSTVRAELPEALDAWFERALAPAPAARFQDAREMARAFADAVREATAVHSPGEAVAIVTREIDDDVPPTELSLSTLPALVPSTSIHRHRPRLAIACAAIALMTGMGAWRGGDVPTASAAAEASTEDEPRVAAEQASVTLTSAEISAAEKQRSAANPQRPSGDRRPAARPAARPRPT